MTKPILFDGAFGTMLIESGLSGGELPELYNLTHPEIVEGIHRKYAEAGADIITTNTFGANEIKLCGKGDVEEVITAACRLARNGAKNKKIALDIGPIGELMVPLGKMEFERAVEIFARQVKAGVKAGVDLIIIETMTDLSEAKAALIAVKENCDLPVYVTMSYQENGKTFLGTDAAAATITLSRLGADAVGINCSTGPDKMISTVKTILKYASCPVIVQPNAGMPRLCGSKIKYDITAEHFIECMKTMLDMGVAIVGGCCGTTPEYISALHKLVEKREIINYPHCQIAAVCSLQKVIEFGNKPIVIGERLNPTGKKRLKQALRERDYAFIDGEANSQITSGADILDVNVGVPGEDEKQLLIDVVGEIQSVCSCPLQLDSSSPEALEAAARIYSGIPVINSVCGTEESLSKVLKTAKKYGAMVVGLTLDEQVPKDAEGRIEIAKRIIDRAKAEGIDKKDILIDCLTMTISASPDQASETLKALKYVTNELNVKTVLGVSNVSFGLPEREIINAAFLCCALQSGLSAAIINPGNERYVQTLDGFNVLSGNFQAIDEYVAKYSEEKQEKNARGGLSDAVIDGIGSVVYEETKKLLLVKSGMEIIDNYYIPALDELGKLYSEGKVFLPQLIKGAEAVQAGFELIRAGSEKKGENKGRIVLATVKGDIHDIGKNIVKLLLISYGFDVIDLGKDVPPEKVLYTVKENNIKLVGLSALMTTSVAAMKDTIALLKAETDCFVMVGGAVLDQSIADAIGADFYGKDARQSVEYASGFFAEKGKI